MSPKAPPVFNRNIRLLSLISFFTDLASEMLYPVMPVFLAGIGYSAFGMGLLEGFAEAVAGISKGYFGALSDRLGNRSLFVRIGYAISAFSKPLTILSSHTAWVFGMRSADRLGKGIRTGARDAMLADESSTANRARVFGFHRAMDTAGAVLGPLFALFYLWKFPGDYKNLFLIALIPGLCTIILSMTIKSRALIPKLKVSALKAGFGSVFKSAGKPFQKAVLMLFLFSLINSSDMFLLLKVHEAGYSDSAAIGFYILYNLFYAVFAYPAALLAGRLQTPRLLGIGFAFFAATYLLVGVSTSLPVIIAGFICYGFFSASTEGNSKAWISKLLPEGEKAAGLGLLAGLQSIGTLCAGIITGTLWWTLSPAVALLVSAAVSIALALLLIFSKLAKNQTAN